MQDETLIQEIEDYLIQNTDNFFDPEMNCFYPSEETQLLENLQSKQPFEAQLKKVRQYLKSRNDQEAAELAGRIDEYLNVLS